MSDPLLVLAVLCTAAAVAESLGSRGIGRRIGGILIVIALCALLANLGVIPSASNAPPLHGQLLTVAAPICIFLLLLDVPRCGAPEQMLGAFAIGAAGTLIGVVLAFWLTDAGDWLGQLAAPIGGMYVATYIGRATTIMPTAQALKRMDLLLPGILVGSLGNAIGTYAGFSAVWLLDRLG